MKPIVDPRNHQRQCLVVLGMHRSGTSALTGVLQFLGVDLGHNLLQPGPRSNPKGFFENREIVHINVAILKRLVSAWGALFPLPERWWQRKSLEECRTEISRIVQSEFDEGSLLGVKDPRLCILLPLWQQIFHEMNIAASYIIILRHPLEIAASLQQRDGFSVEKSLLLWMRSMLSAEWYSRNSPRVCVSFDQLLHNPGATVNTIASALSINFPHTFQERETAIRQFLTPKLRHHRVENTMGQPLFSYMATCYELLQGLVNPAESPSKTLEDLTTLGKEFFCLAEEFYQLDIPYKYQRLQHQVLAEYINSRYTQNRRDDSSVHSLATRFERLNMYYKSVETVSRQAMKTEEMLFFWVTQFGKQCREEGLSREAFQEVWPFFERAVSYEPSEKRIHLERLVQWWIKQGFFLQDHDIWELHFWWRAFQRALPYEMTLEIQAEDILDWWSELWYQYWGSGSATLTMIYPGQHTLPPELYIELLQGLLAVSHEIVSPAEIFRLWHYLCTQGIISESHRYGITALYLTVFGQVLIKHHKWDVGIEALMQALKLSWHPRALEVWGRFFSNGIHYFMQRRSLNNVQK